LLDGFPRTLAQAEALAELLRTANREHTAAVLIDAPDEVVLERIAGRDDGRDDDAPETARVLSSFTEPRRRLSPTTRDWDSFGALTPRGRSRPSTKTHTCCSPHCRAAHQGRRTHHSAHQRRDGRSAGALSAAPSATQRVRT
jgi:hypothetical protein